ncbi:MAG: hypothetical protein HC842_04755 [Cytophagales bacterium]|nr:hypothetical protein [Cytophagales bacterium]
MKNKSWILLLLLGSMAHLAIAQRFGLEAIGKEQGLSHSLVKSITQDRQGFMWFGTGNGLCRYDGQQIKCFKARPGDSTALGNPIINCLELTPNGDLYVGTQNGLYRYATTEERFIHMDAASVVHNNILQLYRDGDSLLWALGSSGLLRFNLAAPEPSDTQPDIGLTQSNAPFLNGLWFPTSATAMLR